MIDHVYISVSDTTRSLAFYLAALQPLGWSEFGFYDHRTGPANVPDLLGIIDQSSGSTELISNTIWLCQRHPGETGLYIGIACDSPAEVDAAYAAALAAGGKDDGGPSLRAHFGPGYYAANILDLDDNRIEFVNKSWNPKRPR
jgi:catechol 2,3-dioxygenase-like lactoylglutathione lyase family enzyme